MQDLKDVTNNVHYENFRYNHLASVTNEGSKNRPGSNKSVQHPSIITIIIIIITIIIIVIIIHGE